MKRTCFLAALLGISLSLSVVLAEDYKSTSFPNDETLIKLISQRGPGGNFKFSRFLGKARGADNTFQLYSEWSHTQTSQKIIHKNNLLTLDTGLWIFEGTIIQK